MSAPPVTLPEWVAPARLDLAGAGSWLGSRREDLSANLAVHGAVLIRGLPLRAPRDLAGLRPALGATAVEPAEWFTRRNRHGDGVYGAPRWQESRKLCLRNELAYSDRPPRRLAVACLRPADEGGETIIGDGRRILAALPPTLVRRARASGWVLVRTFRRYVGSSWREAFGTEDAHEVEAYCAGHDISIVWLPADGLRTSRRRPAVIRHPETGAECWFNQLAFLSRWALDPAERAVLETAFGPAGLPVDTFLGDGPALTRDEYEAIDAANRAAERRVAWRAGDLLVLDNLATAHGRRPYRGRRELAVTMLDPVALPLFDGAARPPTA